jgi:hypothetical protein
MLKSIDIGRPRGASVRRPFWAWIVLYSLANPFSLLHRHSGPSVFFRFGTVTDSMGCLISALVALQNISKILKIWKMITLATHISHSQFGNFLIIAVVGTELMDEPCRQAWVAVRRHGQGVCIRANRVTKYMSVPIPLGTPSIYKSQDRTLARKFS